MVESFLGVSGDWCDLSSHLRHLRLQPAGRRPRGLHQPNCLHLRGLSWGGGGGSAERRPAGLQPHRHEQTLRSAATFSSTAGSVTWQEIPDVCVTCSGEHPRTGALDVCPFIPVQNVSMDDCVRCANVFGQKLAEMLHVPGETPPCCLLIWSPTTGSYQTLLTKYLYLCVVSCQCIFTEKQLEKRREEVFRLSEPESTKLYLRRWDANSQLDSYY